MGALTKFIRNLFDKSGSSQQPEDGREPERLDPDVSRNFSKIRQAFGNSKDVVTALIRDGDLDSGNVGIVFLEGLADPSVVHEMIKEPLIRTVKAFRQEADHDRQDKLAFIQNNVPAVEDSEPAADLEAVYHAILSGETVILADGCPYGLIASSSGGKERGVEEPTTQSVVRGPREGFTESIHTNISLLRRRIRTPQLWLETMTIGKFTQTGIGVMYINGIVNEKVVEEVRQRLQRIEIDGILESGYIEELIQDETFTLFPTLYNSERPDVIAAGLLEGRVAILVDGTPFALLAPALFVQFYQSAEDYYQRAEFATLIRMLRYGCFFISLLAPSLYIAITTFHQELLPSALLFSLASQREGIPFPAFVEAFIMEVTFEILREAGVRLPKTVGQAVSIVGALVIGQAAVEAGLVSPAMVIVVAITAISNFVIPAFNMGISIRILRFVLMIFGATFGLFGVIVGVIGVVQHLCSLRSFGVPYMTPMGPFIVEDQKDVILRFPQWALFARPRLMSKNNRIRERNAPTTRPERKSNGGA
ncbi:spore germination protein [Paenibacillus arenilitoris]|uniref:Spore germination protein n=1 Tax=Paenibacillus arenilitoris TaxID=2772299 RepID=A0A927H4D0_9BACL|nr:spore germination protein [Paenibacillus arenilitoris]MBD2867348.1 spore germination protein [Paenibacillus arenilitoris]